MTPDSLSLAIQTRRQSACTNPAHDHMECAGAEVTTDGGGVRMLEVDEPMLCNDCRKPMHYDRGAETYVHDAPDAECFLHGPGLPEGATPCSTGDPNYAAASDVFAGDWDNDGSDVVYLPTSIGTKLLERQGWVIEPARGGESYTIPGHTPRSQGGKAGHDYFWHRQDAIRLAIAAEALR
jgi:hypothetical protein